MVAAGEGKLEAARILLDYNANANAENGKGSSALLWASANGHETMVSLLSQHTRSDASGSFGAQGQI